MHNTLKALHLNAVAGCYLWLRQNLSLGRGCALCFDADRASDELRVAGRVTMSGYLVDAKRLWIPIHSETVMMVAFFGWLTCTLKLYSANSIIMNCIRFHLITVVDGNGMGELHDFRRILRVFAVVIRQIVYKMSKVLCLAQDVPLLTWSTWAHDPILSLDYIALRKITWGLWKGM